MGRVVLIMMAALLVLPAACKKKDGKVVDGGSGKKGVAPPAPPPPPAPPQQPKLKKDGGAAAHTDRNKTADWATKVVRPLLQKEAKSRPKNTPKAEAILDALQKAGVKIRGRNQALGSIVGASFCMGADTRTMLGLMVCEYKTEGAAKKGVESARLLFGQAVTTKIAVNKKTTLSVTYHAKSAKTQTESKKILDLFAKM